jgi:tetratricopeptide (TPR) repeat protein
MTELDQLLDRLELALADADHNGAHAGDGVPPGDAVHPRDSATIASLCEQLANTLLGLGATGPAARWRTLALIEPSLAELAPALGHTRQELQALGLSPAAGEAPLAAATPVGERALGLLATGEAAAALALLESQARDSGLHPEHCNAVASLLLQLGQSWEAERWLCTSLTHNRRQPRPWFQLARLLLDQGVLDEALEAVQQGLAIDAASDWGRNLRARILLAGGGWRSYDHLVASADALPADPQARLGLEGLRGRWARRGLGTGMPQPLPLPQRLELRRLLPLEGLVVLLHSHQADPLCWLQEQGVLPQGLAVQPLASRDPLLVAERLAAAGFDARREQPAALMKQLAADAQPPVELLVLQRPWSTSLPIALGGLLPKTKRLLTPAGLLTPPQFTPLAAWQGWQLLGPQNSPETT